MPEPGIGLQRSVGGVRPRESGGEGRSGEQKNEAKGGQTTSLGEERGRKRTPCSRAWCEAVASRAAGAQGAGAEVRDQSIAAPRARAEMVHRVASFRRVTSCFMGPFPFCSRVWCRRWSRPASSGSIAQGSRERKQFALQTSLTPAIIQARRRTRWGRVLCRTGFESLRPRFEARDEPVDETQRFAVASFRLALVTRRTRRDRQPDSIIRYGKTRLGVLSSAHGQSSRANRNTRAPPSAGNLGRAPTSGRAPDQLCRRSQGTTRLNETRSLAFGSRGCLRGERVSRPGRTTSKPRACTTLTPFL